MKQYYCPGCKKVWAESDLILSQGGCSECGQLDELELLINQGWYREVIRHLTDLSKAQMTEQTAWDAINFAKAALAMLEHEE